MRKTGSSLSSHTSKAEKSTFLLFPTWSLEAALTVTARFVRCWYIKVYKVYQNKNVKHWRQYRNIITELSQLPLPHLACIPPRPHPENGKWKCKKILTWKFYPTSISSPDFCIKSSPSWCSEVVVVVVVVCVQRKKETIKQGTLRAQRPSWLWHQRAESSCKRETGWPRCSSGLWKHAVLCNPCQARR